MPSYTIPYLLNWRALPTRLKAAILVPVLWFCVGSVGYRLIEGPGWSLLDAVYMTAIVLTTLGFGETHPLSNPGRVFTIFLSFGGIFTLFFTAGETLRVIVSGELKRQIEASRMELRIKNFDNHLIICGLGRMGQLICRQFEEQKESFVIIDRDADRLAAFDFQHGVSLQGDATDDETLKKAGIERARSLVTVLPTDADNVYVVLSARHLNEKIQIVSRAADDSAEVKLRRTGANHVVSPYLIGGQRIAHAVLRPTTGLLLDRAIWRSQPDSYLIDEFEVGAGSAMANRSIKESRIHEELGIVVLTLKQPDGTITLNPLPSEVPQVGAILVVVGEGDKMPQLVERLESPPGGKSS